MTKKLHTDVKIFFENPYVVMVDYECENLTGTPAAYKDALKVARKLINGTWGHTICFLERTGTVQNITNSVWSLNSSFNEGLIYRSYFCFKDELDAMQFRLSVGAKATHVRMWPSNKTFTIYEYTEGLQ